LKVYVFTRVMLCVPMKPGKREQSLSSMTSHLTIPRRATENAA
jgi:hypothetical protein